MLIFLYQYFQTEELERLQRLQELRKQQLEQTFLAQIHERQMRELQAEQLKFQQIQNSLQSTSESPAIINLSSSSEDGAGFEANKNSDSDIKILSEDEVLAAEGTRKPL